MTIELIGQAARAASRAMARATSAQKDDALERIARRVEAAVDAILEANAKDVERLPARPGATPPSSTAWRSRPSA